MTRHAQRGKRQIVSFGTARELEQLLDNFQALDRTVVETFMRLYETPVKRQSAMRVQNRRLHAAISKPLRRLLSHNAAKDQG